MSRTLHHRGPDKENFYLSAGAALIHTNLNIMDYKHRSQPMILNLGEREYTIVFDGAIYNIEELRKKLKDKGHFFRGHSDTEVILRTYIEWDDECVSHLNGVFAFAIWEKNDARLFIARDRIGFKPLFYTTKGDTFLFGSELKTILAHSLVDAKINVESIAEIMLIGPGRTPGFGVFCDIEELPPAHCASYDSKNGLQLHQYWQLQDEKHTDTFDQTVEKVRHLLLDSINNSLSSDVPVGAFLSGGLDSSIISAVAAKHFKKLGKQLHTFSVDYKNNENFFKSSKFQPDSDQAFIQHMKEYLGPDIIHTQILLETHQLLDTLYQAVDARDLPGMADIDASLLLFAAQAKKHVGVALSGEGADEIFGGYPWFRDEKVREKGGFPWAQSTEFRNSFLKKDFAVDAKKYVDQHYKNTLEQVITLENISPLERRMREMTQLNLQWFARTLLERKDRMTMYNSLEVRIPFCDHNIIEYLYTVPWEMKDYKDREKGLLREAMKGLLPETVLWRKKSPYPKTHNPDYLNAVSAKLKQVINDPTSPLLIFVDKEALENLLQTQNATPWYGQLMTTPQTIAYFLQINYWLQKYNIVIV